MAQHILGTLSFSKHRWARRALRPLVVVSTVLIATLNVFSTFGEPSVTTAAYLSPFLVQLTHLTAVLSGFMLLNLLPHLWQRSQNAWTLAVVTTAVLTINQSLRGSVLLVIATILLILCLLWQRREFYGRVGKPSLGEGMFALARTVLFVILYGTAGFYWLTSHYTVPFTLQTALWQTTLLLTGATMIGVQPLTDFGRFFIQSVYAVEIVAISYALFMLLRPLWQRPAPTALVWQHASEIIQQYGRAAVTPFALSPDNSYWFSEGGSVVAYVVKARIALVLGDAIGPLNDAAEAIRGFRDFCHQQGWQPAFYQTLPDYSEWYKAAGFDVVCIGHEALVDVQAVHPLAVSPPPTIHIEIAHPPHNTALLKELREIDEEWLTIMYGQDVCLSFSRFDEVALNHTVLVICRDAQNQISAFASVILAKNRSKAAVDLLRRRHEVETNTLDALLAAVLRWCQEQGVETLNLGLSLCAETTEAADHVGLQLGRFYELQGAHQAPEKFNPHWEPRYVVFPGYVSFPAVCLALTLASTANSDDWRVYLGERPLLLKQIARMVQEQYTTPQTLISVPLEIGVPEATSHSS